MSFDDEFSHMTRPRQKKEHVMFLTQWRQDACKTTRMMLLAVNYLHSCGVVHRDLKLGQLPWMAMIQYVVSRDAKGHPVVWEDDVFAFFVLPSWCIRAFTVDIRYLFTNSHNLHENQWILLILIAFDCHCCYGHTHEMEPRRHWCRTLIFVSNSSDMFRLCAVLVASPRKLENFLYENKNSDFLKLIDFGFSKVWAKNTKMELSCGTLSYAAPEVLAKSYTSQCDLWSLGVIVFILLVSYLILSEPWSVTAWPFGPTLVKPGSCKLADSFGWTMQPRNSRHWIWTAFILNRKKNITILNIAIRNS